MLDDPDLTPNEKRAILASWASDACAVEASPALRTSAKGGYVRFDDIMEALRRYHSLLIGERTAEQIKIQIGAAMKDLETPPDDIPVNGRDLVTGIPKQIMVSYQEVAEALDKSIFKIEEAILKALETTITTLEQWVMGLSERLDAIANSESAKKLNREILKKQTLIELFLKLNVLAFQFNFYGGACRVDF